MECTLYGSRPQLFDKTFTGLGWYGRGVQNGNVLVCYDCFEVRTVNGQTLRQLIRDRSDSLERDLELMVKGELSTTGEKFLTDFSK